MTKKYDISIEQDENWMFVWEVFGLPACYTQAKTVWELFDRLLEVSRWSVELLNDLEKNKTENLKFSLNIDYA